MNYLRYKDSNIKNYIITRDYIDDKVSKLLLDDRFSLYKKGKTIDNNDIFALKIGSGSKRVIIWAGMHGNEHTGISSLFDFTNYLVNNESKILSKFTFVIIYCVNVDGLIKFTRVNYLNIDVNRDAKSLQSNESKFLMSVIYKFEPDLCINLHDQRSIFNVTNGNPALLSFLSPSEDYQKKISDNRKYIMQLISYVNKNLQLSIKNNIGRYSDDFYPTAFGDNLMKLGYKNILIESGIGYNDFYREITRKYTFLSLVYILDFLKNEDNSSTNYLDYFDIPENNNKMYDIIIRNGIMRHLNDSFKVDIGITIEISPNNQKNSLNKVYKISNVGDLSNYYGHLEIDATYREIRAKQTISVNDEVNFYVGTHSFYDLL